MLTLLKLLRVNLKYEIRSIAFSWSKNICIGVLGVRIFNKTHGERKRINQHEGDRHESQAIFQYNSDEKLWQNALHSLCIDCNIQVVYCTALCVDCDVQLAYCTALYVDYDVQVAHCMALCVDCDVQLAYCTAVCVD